MKSTDLTGRRFARLFVMSRADTVITSGGYRYFRWKCRCDCGVETHARASELKSGRKRSCGCLNVECSTSRIVDRNLKHGHGRKKPSRTYQSWSAMRARCLNPAHQHYRLYGGRGITICARWADDFSMFLADMGERPDNHSLDRINPDGDYEPGNCRWATTSMQARNRRNLVLSEAAVRRIAELVDQGVTRPVRISEITGISADNVEHVLRGESWADVYAAAIAQIQRAA